MNVPENPPMERSEVTVNGETRFVISGALTSLQLYRTVSCVRDRRHEIR
jgi:hypothetical protein